MSEKQKSRLVALDAHTTEMLGEVDPKDHKKFIDGTPVPTDADIMIATPKWGFIPSLLPTTYISQHPECAELDCEM